MAPLDLPGVFLRLMLAAGLGAAIGIEREYRQKPAGLRTNILIGMGAALFAVVSQTMASRGGAADRIAANVITGIGFLGGGAILRSGTNVHGMTTAATIWVNAAIGMAIGFGDYVLGTAATVVTLIVLAVLPPIEGYFERRAGIANQHRPPPRRPTRKAVSSPGASSPSEPGGASAD